MKYNLLIGNNISLNLIKKYKDNKNEYSRVNPFRITDQSGRYAEINDT